MPTYEYRCETGHEFEAFQKMSDAPLTECPTCGGPARRKISAGAGLVFKGSGFYITDYKNKSGPGDASAAEKKPAGDKKPGKPESAKSESTKADSAGGTGSTGGGASE